jgi:hypothetical protein
MFNLQSIVGGQWSKSSPPSAFGNQGSIHNQWSIVNGQSAVNGRWSIGTTLLTVNGLPPRNASTIQAVLM